MSESALVAAIRPKSNGSSTIGMKKSVVETIAWDSFKRNTAASSEVSLPTRRSGWVPPPGMSFSNSASTPGAILQPHPPPCESDVRRGSALSDDIGILHPRLHMMAIAIRLGLSPPIVRDAVLQRHLGADDRLSAHVHQFWVVIE